MAQSPMQTPPEAIALAHPVALATYARYAEAQRVVDYLSDQHFPVENCMIVGTDLRQLERVTGRMTQQKAALGGLLSGAWLGLFIGLVMSMFDGQGARTVVTTVLFGALFGLVWALIGYAMTRGRRDFTSVTTVVATRYEVLVEHSHLGRAREVLGGLPNNGLGRPGPAGDPSSTPQSWTAAPPGAVGTGDAEQRRSHATPQDRSDDEGSSDPGGRPSTGATRLERPPITRAGGSGARDQGGDRRES